MTRTAGVSLAVAITVAVALLYEGYVGELDVSALAAVAGFYVATGGIIIAFAVWTAAELGISSLLILEPVPAAERWRRWLVYGPALGVVLSAGSYALAGDTGAALRPWFWQRIQTPVGTALFSARAAVLEETFFRLFLITFLLRLTARPGRYRLAMRDGSARAERDSPEPWRGLAIAVVVSSVLFGLAHPFNPVPAMLLGPLLALAYIRGGWESAVTAHLVANFLVFTVYF